MPLGVSGYAMLRLFTPIQRCRPSISIFISRLIEKSMNNVLEKMFDLKANKAIKNYNSLVLTNNIITLAISPNNDLILISSGTSV